MSRVKTFDSSGIAPGGRLFAGDMNSIQDQYADLSNFSQTHDVGTLRIGDSSIQLLKFGTSEARLSSAMRTDGIFRGLGGLYGGQFTTAARNGIAAGSRPSGLIIYNTSTGRYEFNSNTDPAPVWTPVSGTDASRFVARFGGSFNASAGGTYYLSNTNFVRSTLGSISYFDAQYIDPFDYSSGNGGAGQFWWRMTIVCNNNAPGIQFTGNLVGLNSPTGGTGSLSPGGFTAGTSAVIVTPTGNSVTTVTTSNLSLSAGYYIAQVTLNAAMNAGSVVAITLDVYERVPTV